VFPSLRLAFLLVFVAFPLLELAILIKAGETIGFWPTISLLIGAGVLGVLVIREEGLSMVGRMLSAVNAGKLPFEPMLDGYARIIAGSLLIVPGFLSDILGLLLLVPPLRAWVIRRVLSGLANGASGDRASEPRPSSRNTVIETTYERIDTHDSDRAAPGPGKDG
jgi:UPF0716 protein FxsA